MMLPRSAMSMSLLPGLFLTGLFSSSDGAYGAPPPFTAGIGIGLGVGLPFINVCINAPKALDFLLVEHFGNEKLAVEKLPNDGDQPAVECPDSLSCDFESDCLSKWQNDPTDRFCDQNFWTVEEKPKGDWAKLMGGGGSVPKGQYLFTASKRTTNGQPIYLTSNIVPKQPGKGTLKLKYWMTEPAILQVCLKLKSSEYALMPGLCSKPVSHSKSTSDAEFEIKGPVKEPFKIVIMCSNLTSTEANMLALDDVEYTSDLC